MSSERPNLASPEISVRALRPDDEIEADLEALTPDERRQAARLQGATRCLFAARRALLRRRLASISGQSPSDVVIAREPCMRCGGPHGRPYPRGLDVHFSVTSVRSPVLLVGVALSDRRVGFDLEAIADIGVVRDVTPQLHPQERSRIADALEVSDDAGRRCFSEIWTRKEALLKGTGEGITGALDRVDVSADSLAPDSWQVTSWPTNRPDVVGAWALRTTRI